MDKNIDAVASYDLEKSYNARRILPAAFLNFHLQKGISQVKYVLGANMSFWRDDLVKVNGYNEDFTGWGKEDNDLSLRLSNAGIKLHFLKFAGIIYHLYHKESPRDRMLLNEALFMETLKEKRTFVANGLKKYLK
jgi:predicted glycosyltransferase involved in capsule biosynthesis